MEFTEVFLLLANHYLIYLGTQEELKALNKMHSMMGLLYPEFLNQWVGF